MNIGFAEAKKYNASWVLTMDQDSLLPDNIISKYEDFISNCPFQIGLIAPQLNMYNGEEKKPRNSFREIHEVLQSGSAISMDAFDFVGGFKEEMFIDGVDFEFCWNIIEHGYKIVQLNSIVMQHHLGETQEYKLLGKHLFYVTHHSPLRHYYMERNGHYMRKLHKDIMPNSTYQRTWWVKGLLKVIFFENQKLQKLRARYRGYRDFRNGIMGKCNYGL